MLPLVHTLVMAISRFAVESMIRGYHEYQTIWLNPVMEEELSCKQKIGNAHNTHAVAIRKTIDGEIKTVGHVSQRISSICLIFIRRGVQSCALSKGRINTPQICHREDWRFHVLWNLYHIMKTLRNCLNLP